MSLQFQQTDSQRRLCERSQDCSPAGQPLFNLQMLADGMPQNDDWPDGSSHAAFSVVIQPRSKTWLLHELRDERITRRTSARKLSDVEDSDSLFRFEIQLCCDSNKIVLREEAEFLFCQHG